jgi:AcrR family transcriptional regulator
MAGKAEDSPKASRRAGGRARATGRGAGTKPDHRAKLIEVALDLAVTEGWGRVSLSAIAAAAGLSLAEAYRIFPSKGAILQGFLQGIDERVLAAARADADEPARDRLFDVLMRRFDALNPHKAAVAAIMRDGADPSVWLGGVPAFLRSMAWMLEAAGLSSAGLEGLIRVKGVCLIWANAARVWLRDDSADMAKTMAALDRGLRQAESLMTMFSHRRGGARHRAPDMDESL